MSGNRIEKNYFFGAKHLTISAAFGIDEKIVQLIERFISANENY